MPNDLPNFNDGYILKLFLIFFLTLVASPLILARVRGVNKPDKSSVSAFYPKRKCGVTDLTKIDLKDRESLKVLRAIEASPIK